MSEVPLCLPLDARLARCPLLREYGTYDKTRFWPWLEPFSGKSPRKLSNDLLFVRKQTSLNALKAPLPRPNQHGELRKSTCITAQLASPFIESQLASQNNLQDFTWCKFGHGVVTLPSESRGTKPSYSTVWFPRRCPTCRELFEPVSRFALCSIQRNDCHCGRLLRYSQPSDVIWLSQNEVSHPDEARLDNKGTPVHYL